MNKKNEVKNVAIIGCGKAVNGKEGWAIGHCHGAAIKALSDHAKLYGVDLSPENLTAFGESFNLPEEQLFPSTESLYQAFIPDVVAICTWPKLHAPMAIEAMEKGVKGIVIEKPIALDVGQIDEISSKAKETGSTVSIAHQRVHLPEFQTYKKIADSGVLGTPLTVHAHVGDDWDILSWTTHWFDMANYIFGSAPKSVLAGMDVTDKRIYQQAVENASIICAEYEDQNTAQFLTGPLSGALFRISGPKGTIVSRDNEILACTDQGVERHPLPTAEGGSFTGPFEMLYLELFEEMSGGPEAKLSISRCAAATEMAYAAHESARTARKVALPLETKFAPIELMQHPATSTLKAANVLLYADSHFNSEGRKGLFKTIESLTQHAPKFIDGEENGITSSDLEDVDYLVIYHTQSEVDEATQEALRKWVYAGKPTAIIHAALGGWKDWEEYTRWCSIIWEWGVSTHPYEPVKLKPTEKTSMNFPYDEAWLPRDEVFTNLKVTSPHIVDATVQMNDGILHPAVWHNVEFPNIVCWMPGHRPDSWSVPAVQQGLGAILESAKNAHH